MSPERLTVEAVTGRIRPGHGPVSGCYPLGPAYKGHDDRQRLAATKARLKEDA